MVLHIGTKARSNRAAPHLCLLLALVMTTPDLRAADSCADILKHGIWEYSSSTSSVVQTSSFLNWFCSKTYSSFAEARQAALTIGIPIEGFPLELGGKYRDTQWNEYRNEMCSYQSGNYRHAAAFTNVATQASTVVVKAWESCVNQVGTRAWLQASARPTAFSLHVRRRSDNASEAPKFVLERVTVRPDTVACEPDHKKIKDKKFTGSTAFSCERRDVKDDVSVLPVVKDLTDPLPELSFAGYKELPPGPTMPPLVTKMFHARMSQPAGGRIDLEVRVDPGYKIISGGARVHYNGYGNLLTASYPTDKNTWVASAKDHEISDPGTLEAWALAIEDRADQWEVKVFRTNSGVAAHPEATATVPPEYRMTGGGAQVNYGGYGNLLTASYPLSSDTWMARSKDHKVSDPASLTVSAIGIKARNNARLPTVQVFSAQSQRVPHPEQMVTLPDTDLVMVGGGAEVHWKGYGNLLTGSFPTPDGRGWIAMSKDHEVSDPSTITAFVIGLARDVRVAPFNRTLLGVIRR